MKRADGIRVLLVEDHQIVREGLRSLLQREEDIEVLGETDSGDRACELARELKPDVILMDLELNGMGGLEATEAIKSEMPEVKILALTMHSDEEHIYSMIKKGADGYLLKYAAAGELVSAIRSLHKGESMLSPAVAQKLIRGIRERSGLSHPDDTLSDREKQILLLMARGATSHEIGDKLFISPKTVDNHRARIIEKLQAKNRVEAVINAVKLGVISLA